MKAIECGGLVPGCDYVARAKSEPELMAAVSRHAREVHGIQMSEALVTKARGAIREEH